MAQILFIDHERKWTKWSQEAFYAQKVLIFSLNPTYKSFRTTFEQKFRRISWFRWYSTENSESLKSCTESQSCKHNAMVINNIKQNGFFQFHSFHCLIDFKLKLKILYWAFQIWIDHIKILHLSILSFKQHLFFAFIVF